MDKPRIGVLSGVARPSRALRRRLGQLYGPEAAAMGDMNRALDDFIGVDALARLLTEGIESVTTKDGRLDAKDLAAFVMRHMKQDGGVR
jgi:hypothetical protein